MQGAMIGKHTRSEVLYTLSSMCILSNKDGIGD